jgi:hypothetical protein
MSQENFVVTLAMAGPEGPAVRVWAVEPVLLHHSCLVEAHYVPVANKFCASPFHHLTNSLKSYGTEVSSKFSH